MKTIFVTGLKGGVGKTIVATNLAYALRRHNVKVGLLDADIPSPNVSEFFELNDMPITEEHNIETIRTKDGGIQIFSMGAMVNDQSISMQEEKYVELVQEVIERGDWDCEYLIVDMPAGSSDLMKSVTQIFANDLLGNIVVVNPAHVKAAERILRWHEINGVNVIGLVENMSDFECPECKKTWKIFGDAKLDGLTDKFNVELIGVIPLSMGVRGAVEAKAPIGGHIGQTFDQMADIIIALKPQKPGFLSSIMSYGKEKVRNQVISAFSTMLTIANKEVPIKDIQVKHGYKGGRDIRINITNDEFTETLSTIDLILKDGQLRVIKGKSEPKLVIGIKAKSLAGSLLGYIKYGDRKVEYSLFDAYLNQDLVTYGESGDTMATLKFIKDTWTYVQQNDRGRMTKMLEMIM